MSSTYTPVPEVVAKARAGDIAGAIAAGEVALVGTADDAALRLFVGVLCCRNGELERGIAHLRRASDGLPGDPVARIELARALLSAGDGPGVLAITDDAGMTSPSGRELVRVRAHGLQLTARAAEARDCFEQLVASDSNDFESHNGLGLASLTLGDSRAALASFRKAVRLQPAGVGFWINLSRAAATLSEWQEAGEAASKALARVPNDPFALLVAARARAGLDDISGATDMLNRVLASVAITPETWSEIAEIYGQMRDFSGAEQAFRRAIAGDPGLVRAWVGLGNIIERLNRQADLQAHLAAASDAGIAEGPLALLHARFARKAGRLDDALALARSAPMDGDIATRAQLVGTLADRLGDHESAFAAFLEANAAIAAATSGMEVHAEANLAHYAEMRALMTPGWVAGLPAPRAPRPGERRDPLFIFGFPRSGTTLIDTMLSGHPDTAVLEEEGIIEKIASAVGQVEHVPALPHSKIEELRERYFVEVDARISDAAGKLAVDKEPLGLSSLLLLQRLFPDARFVFAERHPCDVVLSCWMTSLRFNHRVGSFHDLVSIARLYDAVLKFWTECVDRLPIKTMTVRYERLIKTPELELRKLASFSGLDWQPALLTHQENAARRAYIGSPSYAQVGEPLYTNAAGRWTRYRPWIDPILPILQPWITRLGYAEI